MEYRVGLVGQRDIQGAQDMGDGWAAWKSPPASGQECRVALRLVWTLLPPFPRS